MFLRALSAVCCSWCWDRGFKVGAWLYRMSPPSPILGLPELPESHGMMLLYMTSVAMCNCSTFVLTSAHCQMMMVMPSNDA